MLFQPQYYWRCDMSPMWLEKNLKPALFPFRCAWLHLRWTWRRRSGPSRARTRCAVSAWRWCTRRPPPPTDALASCPAAATPTVSAASASGAAPSSLRTRSSSECQVGQTGELLGLGGGVFQKSDVHGDPCVWIASIDGSEVCQIVEVPECFMLLLLLCVLPDFAGYKPHYSILWNWKKKKTCALTASAY